MRLSIKFIVIIILLLGLVILNCGGTTHNRHNITKRVFNNGLTVIVKRIDKNRLTAINIRVKAGYHNGVNSLYGISELLGKLLPYGAKSNRLRKYFKSETSVDYTDFYATLPHEKLKEGLKYSAEFLRGPNFNEAELKREKDILYWKTTMAESGINKGTVEGEIKFLLGTAQAGNNSIEALKQIRQIHKSDLLDYYHKFYTPKNTIITIVSSINANDVFHNVEQHYGFWNPGYSDVSDNNLPQQNKFQHIVYSLSDIIYPRVSIIFPTPGFSDSDMDALRVLSRILGEGKSSRLQRSLVEDNRLVYSVDSDLLGLRDFGLFVIRAKSKNINTLTIEKEIYNQIRQIITHGVTQYEIEKAVNTIISEELVKSEDILYQARNMAMQEQYGDSHKSATRYRDKFGKLTASDIKRVAEEYLNIDKSKVVEYLPVNTKRERCESDIYLEFIKKGYRDIEITGQKRIPTLAPSEIFTGRRNFPSVKFTTSDGKTIIIKENHSVPMVDVKIAFEGGVNYENKNNAGITKLTTASLIKGSKNYTFEQITDLLEGAGGTITYFVKREYFGIDLEIPSEYLNSALIVLSDIVCNPEFNSLEIEIEKEKQIERIGENKYEIKSLPRCILAKTSSNSIHLVMPLDGDSSVVSKFSKDDLLRWYNKFKSSKRFYITAVGDIDRFKFRDKVEYLFADIKKSKNVDDYPKTAYNIENKTIVEKWDKPFTAQAIGFLTDGKSGDDYYLIDMLRYYVSDLCDSLFDNSVFHSSFAYECSITNKAFLNFGIFNIYIASPPGNEKRARDRVITMLLGLRDNPISNQSLLELKDYALCQNQKLLQIDALRAERYVEEEIKGNDFSRVESYPYNIDNISKLEINSAAQKYFYKGNMAICIARGR